MARFYDNVGMMPTGGKPSKAQNLCPLLMVFSILISSSQKTRLL